MTPIEKKRCIFAVKDFCCQDYQLLARMYDEFTPKAKFQGMPPYHQEVRERWLKKLLETGFNFVAWCEGVIVGHGALLPDLHKKDAEYVVFVCQTHRGFGIGKELTGAAKKKSRDLGLETVWLTVDAYNFRAIQLYRKAGFQMQKDYGSATERLMILPLKDMDA